MTYASHLHNDIQTIESHLGSLARLSGSVDIEELKSGTTPARNVGKDVLSYTIYKPIVGALMGFATGGAVRKLFNLPRRSMRTGEFPRHGAATYGSGPGAKSSRFDRSQTVDIMLVGLAKLASNVTVNLITGKKEDISSRWWEMSGALSDDVNAYLANAKLIASEAKSKLTEDSDIAYANSVLDYIEKVAKRANTYKYVNWGTAALNGYHAYETLKYSQRHDIRDTLFTLGWAYFGGYEALGYAVASGFAQPKLLPSFEEIPSNKLIVDYELVLPKHLTQLASQLPNAQLMRENPQGFKVVKDASQMLAGVRESSLPQTVSSGYTLANQLLENCKYLIREISTNPQMESSKLKSLAALLSYTHMLYSKVCVCVGICVVHPARLEVLGELERQPDLNPRQLEEKHNSTIYLKLNKMWYNYVDCTVDIYKLPIDYANVFGTDRPIPTDLAIRYGTLNRILLSPIAVLIAGTPAHDNSAFKRFRELMR